MGSHITENGKFQSDKYPWCKPGFVPLKLSDKMAQPVLADYAQRRRTADAEFADDLEACLRAEGAEARGDLDDGGCAFPGASGHDGMSLRDYFAGLAMQAEISTMFDNPASEATAQAALKSGETIPEHTARISYEMSDAMLRQRLK